MFHTFHLLDIDSRLQSTEKNLKKYEISRGQRDSFKNSPLVNVETKRANVTEI